MTTTANTPTPEQPSEDRVDLDPALAPSYSRAQPGESQSSDASSTIDWLRALWAMMLGQKDIAQDADFFDLGGDSLAAVVMMSKVRAEFRIELRVVALLEYPTLETLATQIDRQLH